MPAAPIPPSCTNGSLYIRDTGFRDGEYAARSDEVHGVMALALLSCTVSYVLFFVGTQGWGGYTRRRPGAGVSHCMGSASGSKAAAAAARAAAVRTHARPTATEL
jgi:hypothetical protein